MTHATTTARQKLVILTGVVAVHGLLLWGLPGVSAPQRLEDVIAVKLVSPEAIAPDSSKAKQQVLTPPVPREPKPAAQGAKQSSQVPSRNGQTAEPSQPQPPTAAPSPAPAIAAAATTASTLPVAGLANNANSVPVAAAGGGSISGATTNSNAVAASQVVLPSSDADYLNNPKPEYPSQSRRRNEQGKVVVNVFIGTDGLAQKAEVKVSSGFERLDAAALATAKAWRYVPGKRGGVPEAMWFAVPINFVME